MLKVLLFEFKSNDKHKKCYMC